MPVYRIWATERIFEETFIRADSKEQAREIATQDWTVEWETFDGEAFEITDVDEIPVEEEKYVKISPVLEEAEEMRNND